jgi:hypothetical protein
MSDGTSSDMVSLFFCRRTIMARGKAMALFRRLESLESMLAFAERLLRWGPLVIGTAGTGLASGWAAYLTEPLAAYAPLSWAASAIFGAVLFIFAFAIWARARLWVQQRELNKSYLRTVSEINPFDDVFHRRSIRIMDFKRPIPENIKNKTFVECDMMGPAIVILNGITTLNGGGMFGCDFVKVKANHPISNAIAFENISMRNSRIFNVTFLIPEYMVPQMPPPGPNGPNWITP